MASSYFKLLILNKKRKINKMNQNPMFPNTKDSTEKKCRICLLVGSKSIFGHKNDCSEYVQIIGGIKLSENDDYPKYLCEECVALLNSAIKFRQRAQESDKILRTNVINECKSQDEDLVSANSDHDEKRSIENKASNYPCNACKKIFYSIKEFAQHNNSKEHKNVRIKCSICNGLLTPQLYAKHLERHQTTSHIVCEVCGKLYRKDNLTRHLQLHTFELPFQCQICPYRGRFMESLKIHMRTHSTTKPYSCDKCPLKFITKSNLSRHLLTHRKERPYKCVECNRGFYTNNDMQSHIKSDHVGIKDHCCKICGNKYGTKKALLRHELRVHKRDKLAKGRRPLYLRPEYTKVVC